MVEPKKKTSSDKISSFDIALQQLRAAEKKKDAEMEMLRKKNQDLKNVIEQLFTDIAPLKDDLKAKDDMINSLKSKTAEKIKAAAKAQDEKRALQDRKVEEILKARDKLLNTYKSKMLEIKKASDSIQLENDKLKGDMNQMKKELVALEVRCDVSEKKIRSLKDSAKKSMYETMKLKEKEAVSDKMIRDTTSKLEVKERQYLETTAKMKADIEEKMKSMLDSNTRRTARYLAQIRKLQEALEAQRKLLDMKKEKEKELIRNFTDNFRKLVDTGDVDIPVVETPAPPKRTVGAEMIPEAPKAFVPPMSTVAPPTESGFITEDEEEVLDFNKIKTIVINPATTEEIMPMIEMALEHGDTEPIIVQSLISSGYDRNNIREAFSRLKKHK